MDKSAHQKREIALRYTSSMKLALTCEIPFGSFSLCLILSGKLYGSPFFFLLGSSFHPLFLTWNYFPLFLPPKFLGTENHRVVLFSCGFNLLIPMPGVEEADEWDWS